MNNLAAVTLVSFSRQLRLAFRIYLPVILDFSQPVTVAGSAGWPKIVITRSDRLKPAAAQSSLLIVHSIGLTN